MRSAFYRAAIIELVMRLWPKITILVRGRQEGKQWQPKVLVHQQFAQARGHHVPVAVAIRCNGIVNPTSAYQHRWFEPGADDPLKRLAFAFRRLTFSDSLARRLSPVAESWSNAAIQNNLMHISNPLGYSCVNKASTQM